MDELNNGEQGQYVEPGKNEKKNNTRKIVKRTLLTAGLALAVYMVYSIVYLFISPDRNIQQIYLVPEDAAFIIQSSAPIEDWEKFSGSETWQCLRKAKSFEEVAKSVEKLDSVVKSNKVLLSLVGQRDLLISLHKTRATDWDFLLIVDMQKASKMDLLKDQVETVLAMSGFTVTNRMHNGINILEMRDPDTRDVFYTAFVDNHLVGSYTSGLVESAINSRNKPKIGLDQSFIETEKLVSGKGLVRVFINYARIPQFMSIYLGARNEYVDLFSNSMNFAGLYLNMDKDRMEVIEKKIKRRSPVKIKSVNYKDFEINYVEMKGFFRLFFGKLFDKFEKPYYTYVDDYVVFSNKAASLLSFVEDYEQKNLLKNNAGFKDAYSYMKSSSTIFLYTDMHKFYSQLKPMMNPATWNEIQSNKDVLYSFPYWTMQVIGDNNLASLQYVMDYRPYEPEEVVAVVSDEEDQDMDEEAVTEKEQMSELKRFYIEI